MARPKNEDKTEEVPRVARALKDCPKCGGKAETFRDHHGLWRCACKDCGFWDSRVWGTGAEAEQSWQDSGDPNQVE